MAFPLSDKIPNLHLSTIPEDLVRDVRHNKPVDKRYYLAEITHWGKGDSNPTCMITQCLGEIGQLKAEKKRILQAIDHEGYPLSAEDESDLQTEIKRAQSQIEEALK